MSNSYFKFKKFTVFQDRCAMKVCTDSCLFGAWINDLIQSKTINVQSALDIGSGTGLLSLMLAQENPILIDAIEIEQNAFEQSLENSQSAELNGTIQLHRQSLQAFTPVNKYDLIFSNPPFFSHDLKSTQQVINLAKHETDMTLADLIYFFRECASADAYVALLMPYHRNNEVKEKMRHAGFFLNYEVLVKQTPKHDFFRSMMLFSKSEIRSWQEEITIKEESGNYSAKFSKLLSKYYLAF